MIKIFDKKFVHFMWDDELQGKEVFVADNINSLIERVEKGASIYKVHWSRDNGMPFESDDLVRYRFAYYDKNYSIKKAFNEGETIQYQLVGGVTWADINSEEALECRIAEGRTFRIKPEEDEKWIAYLVRQANEICYLAACRIDRWEFVQKIYGAKTQLFIGTEDEAVEWCNSRERFAEVIKAWEDEKTIQYYYDPDEEWVDVEAIPAWNANTKYRVKPECPCADGIDSKACVGCEQSEDGKPHPFENYHCYGCNKSSKKECRPYESSAEMIADFIDRFKAKCPSYCEPLVWVKDKQLDCRYLITAFMPFDVEIGSLLYKFKQLFDEYTYLDESPVGIEVKE